MNINNVHVLILTLHLDSHRVSDMRVKATGQNDILGLTDLLFFVIVQKSAFSLRFDRDNILPKTNVIFVLDGLVHDLEQFGLRHVVRILAKKLVGLRCLL